MACPIPVDEIFAKSIECARVVAVVKTLYFEAQAVYLFEVENIRTLSQEQQALASDIDSIARTIAEKQTISRKKHRMPSSSLYLEINRLQKALSEKQTEAESLEARLASACACHKISKAEVAKFREVTFFLNIYDKSATVYNHKKELFYDLFRHMTAIGTALARAESILNQARINYEEKNAEYQKRKDQDELMLEIIGYEELTHILSESPSICDDALEGAWGSESILRALKDSEAIINRLQSDTSSPTPRLLSLVEMGLALEAAKACLGNLIRIASSQNSPSQVKDQLTQELARWKKVNSSRAQALAFAKMHYDDSLSFFEKTKQEHERLDRECQASLQKIEGCERYTQEHLTPEATRWANLLENTLHQAEVRILSIPRLEKWYSSGLKGAFADMRFFHLMRPKCTIQPPLEKTALVKKKILTQPMLAQKG